jgi:hypothetical protein
MKFDVILYQFPNHLERTFLHNRTAGCPRKTMVSQLKTNYIYVFIFYIIVSYGYVSSGSPILKTLTAGRK